MADGTKDRRVVGDCVGSAGEILRGRSRARERAELRDRFAMKAFELTAIQRFNAVASRFCSDEEQYMNAAIRAYGYADALMAVRDGVDVGEQPPPAAEGETAPRQGSGQAPAGS